MPLKWDFYLPTLSPFRCYSHGGGVLRDTAVARPPDAINRPSRWPESTEINLFYRSLCRLSIFFTEIIHPSLLLRASQINVTFPILICVLNLSIIFPCAFVVLFVCDFEERIILLPPAIDFSLSHPPSTFFSLCLPVDGSIDFSTVLHIPVVV